MGVMKSLMTLYCPICKPNIDIKHKDVLNNRTTDKNVIIILNINLMADEYIITSSIMVWISQTRLPLKTDHYPLSFFQKDNILSK